MTAKLYKKSGLKNSKPIRGQAAVVWAHLSDTPQLAKDVTRAVAESGRLNTSQDKYRVTLYYILVFKKQGLVDAVEPVVEPETVEPTELQSLLPFETAEVDAVDA